MKKDELRRLLDAETGSQSRKPWAEFAGGVAWERGEGPGYHQFEAGLIEQGPDYLHVMISIDDGSVLKSVVPVSRSFIVCRDGRVEM